MYRSDGSHCGKIPKRVKSVVTALYFRPLVTESEDNVAPQSSLSPEEECTHIKQVGYAASKRIRIYGEEFEVLSDPFPTPDGIAIHVRSMRSSLIRVLQLPTTITHRVSRPLARTA
jgi:hypothetical protein